MNSSMKIVLVTVTLAIVYFTQVALASPVLDAATSPDASAATPLLGTEQLSASAAAGRALRSAVPVPGAGGPVGDLDTASTFGFYGYGYPGFYGSYGGYGYPAYGGYYGAYRYPYAGYYWG